VPVVEGLDGVPGSDAMKHFGAAMASFGSIALFHLVGITPEAMRLEDVGGERLPLAHRDRRGRRAGAAARVRDHRRGRRGRVLGAAAEPL
jgi:predicted aconitase